MVKNCAEPVDIDGKFGLATRFLSVQVDGMVAAFSEKIPASIEYSKYPSTIH